MQASLFTDVTDWSNIFSSFLQGSHSEGGGAHAKFTNYSFDEEEFTKLVQKAVKHVKNHPLFKKIVRKATMETLEHNEL